ncbi:MAG: peptide ligase PGM1-related protein [Aeromicrobium sp.]
MAPFDPHARLARARAAHRPGPTAPHTVVVLPSYSVSPSLLARYGPRIPALEHRQLVSLLMLARVPRAQMVFVTTTHPSEQVLDYYLSFLPADRRHDTRARIRIVEVPDASQRSITAKLLDRPDLMARIRTMTRGRLAFIEPWNVTSQELELADRLGIPLNGTHPSLWPLGFKSSGRQLMRRAGVPVPLGQEDVRSVGDVLTAAEGIRHDHPAAAGMVIKLDNSGAGDGNRVFHFGAGSTPTQLQHAVEALGQQFLTDLEDGAVVEELVTGRRFASPSVQVDIAPFHRVKVVSTHEQILGGPSGQVYLGCRFPANPGYRHQLTTYGEAIGELLAERGAMGRFCVDFAAARSRSARWTVRGLEINLRKSGTSHPFALLQCLVPGRYDVDAGTWTDEHGNERCYRSTDSLADPAWRGRPAGDVIDAIRSAGLAFDPGSGTGTVLHMFVGLDIDGLIGLTAIGRSPDDADRMHRAAEAAIRASGSAPGHGSLSSSVPGEAGSSPRT